MYLPTDSLSLNPKLFLNINNVPRVEGMLMEGSRICKSLKVLIMSYFLYGTVGFKKKKTYIST